MKLPQYSAIVGALSDGAGSAQHAGIAAQLACKTALKYVFGIRHSLPWHDVSGEEWKANLISAVQAARGRLEVLADTSKTELRQYACTLILFVATPYFIVCMQVGDGAVIIEDAKGELTSLTSPSQSEFLNIARMLTAPELIADVNSWPGDLRSVAAFSDGLQLLCTTYPEGRPHIPFFGPVFRFLNAVPDKTDGQLQLKKFLEKPHIRKASGDDLTLMLGTIRPKPQGKGA